MNALQKISYGLYILTTKTNKINGCVINTLMQVTSTPNQISITVNKDNETTKMIQKSGLFNVSILDKTTPFELIKHFGFSSGKDVNKFDGFKDYKLSKNKIPYLTTNSVAYISAKVVNTIDVGTHLTFIAEVEEEDVLSDEEPLTYAYYHSNIKPKSVQKKGVWVCRICGYVYEGETMPDDFICPICKHGKSDFEKIVYSESLSTKKMKTTKKSKGVRKFYCPTCGNLEESDVPPQKCVICGKPMIEI